MKFSFLVFVLLTFIANNVFSGEFEDLISNSIKATEKKKTLGDKCYIQNYIAELDFSQMYKSQASPGDSIESEIPSMPTKLTIPIRIYHADRNKMRLEANFMMEKFTIIKNGDFIYTLGNFKSKEAHYDTIDIKKSTGKGEFVQILDFLSVQHLSNILKSEEYSKVDGGVIKDTSSELQKIFFKNIKDTTKEIFIDTSVIYIDTKTKLPVKAEIAFEPKGTNIKIIFNYGEYDADRDYYICSGFIVQINDGGKEKFEVNITQSKIDFKVQLDEILFIPK